MLSINGLDVYKNSVCEWLPGGIDFAMVNEKVVRYIFWVGTGGCFVSRVTDYDDIIRKVKSQRGVFNRRNRT